ncbi:phosphotransferase family protein [Methanofollis fontis]|uniref:Serine/threonine protein phosphatase n=1 Tax=Methanofollis fontis TaxID=2052832 RepID=A0A483CSA5_9EURY|nr:aminoglycoside phosphotransferase family protein [Methanofollis fontis]TAJ45748.1 serine/threonine protein phosphatase [Methanofollis fontis]
MGTGHEQHVATLYPGDPFRDWIAELLGHRLRRQDAPARVSLIRPSSHTVCRYTFQNGPSVVAKFFAEPTGANHCYNPEKGMNREYRLLKRAMHVIPVSEPLGIRKDYNCVLVTSYLPGKPLSRSLRDDPGLHDRLAAVADLLRHLHSIRSSRYSMEREFSNVHDVLDQNRLSAGVRDRFNRLLGEWWHSGDLERKGGCMIHRDATPANYIFGPAGVAAIDFESAWTGGHPVHDVGVFCAEIKYAFKRRYDNPEAAEPYIGQFLRQYARSSRRFSSVTGCVPFYMGLGYLRMARLGLGGEEREWLIQEAMRCLVRR